MTELDVPSLAVTGRTLSPHAESTWRRLEILQLPALLVRQGQCI